MQLYENYIKRVLDFMLSLIAIIVFLPLFVILMLFGCFAMKGNPFFYQLRPGKKNTKTNKEKIFKLIKFRTMSNAKDKEGNFLPDDVRLNSYGKFLRGTSLDELPSLINILLGDLSIVGPRPQLVRDMVFMSKEQRKRHDIRPGLTGLAQINGRNNITWEQKFKYDLSYIKDISFMNDMKIIFKTIGKVLKCSDVVREGTVSDMDFGDWLLKNHEITLEEYDNKQSKAKRILKEEKNGKV